MAIKAITIDFWNTLFDSSNGINRNNVRQRALIKAIDKHGLSVSGEEYNNAVQASWAMFNEVWHQEHRTPSPKDLVSYIWNYLNLPEDSDAINEVLKAFEDSILLAPPKLIAGVKQSLALLKVNYKLAIVSDTGFSPGSVMRTLLKTTGIFDYFDAFSFSNETGVSKPDPKAFYAVLNELKCEPANALHIGDIERTDIIGAKSISMKAILYDGDPTAFLNQSNPLNSIADARVSSWFDIPEIVNKIDDINISKE